MAHILRANILGNPNVGLYGFANDKFCIVGKDVSKKLAEKIKDVLKVPVYRTTIAGTSLIGVFVSGNNNRILVPSIAFPNEIGFLREKGINVEIIDTRFTALGNNILCNDNCAIISIEFEEETKEKIEKALGIPVKAGMIADSEVVGSCCVLTDNDAYVHPEIKDFELDFLKTNLKVKITKGTVTMGNPYVGSGIIVNKNGFVAGDTSTGIELTNIDEAFGFIG